MNPQNLSLDFRTFVLTAGVLLTVFGLVTLLRAFRLFITRDDLRYSRLRQRQSAQAWQRILTGSLMLAVSGWLFTFGEQSIYRVFPVTPTPSPTATASLTPSPTLSPTITLTPSLTPTLQFSLTPTPTSIPRLPQSISSLFESSVTPDPGTAFSPLTFSRTLDVETYNLGGVGATFANPVGQIYATFSYDQMLPGVQWTAIWYREGELVNFETLPWNGGTGGLGFTEWTASAEEWTPGFYQVQIFVGEELAVLGEFSVEGGVLTSTPTQTSTPTATPTFTATPTPTVTPTHTRFPTSTTSP